MKNLSSNFLALALALATPALAQVAGYGQCGGNGFTGSTTCVSGWTCTYSNAYYSQCLPGSASSSSSIKTTTSSKTTSTPISTTSKTTTTSSVTSTTKTTTSATTTSTSAPAPSGFVTASGQKFALGGSTYTLVGSNAYWVGLQGYTTAQINQAFSDIAKSGATTVRTWGFNEVTTTYSGEDYYQIWNGAQPTINTGATGLANFDTVVAAAKANGLRLIVTLTNNWSDYGGMDVYTKQLTGSLNHDVFYTNALTQAAYKSYVSTWVGRYKNEPTILAWELANEPRCSGSTPNTSGTCTAETVTAWIKTMSAYIKSLDANHLVAIGDEGWFNEPSSSQYPYQAGESIGIDFVANLAIPTVDFGTFHLYPESWGQAANATEFGVGWIQDHAAAQKAQNKPVILEEFGVTTANQSTTYTLWLNTVISSGLTGDLIWQAGSHFSTGDTPNDGYAVYPDGPIYPIVKAHAAALKARG